MFIPPYVKAITPALIEDLYTKLKAFVASSDLPSGIKDEIAVADEFLICASKNDLNMLWVSDGYMEKFNITVGPDGAIEIISEGGKDKPPTIQ